MPDRELWAQSRPLSRRAFLAGAGTGAAALGGLLPRELALARPRQASSAAYRALAREVRSDVQRSWRAYRRLAFGQDELRPVSGTGTHFFAPGKTFGLTVVEAMDTLYLMGLDVELAEAEQWVTHELDVGQDAFVSVFETIIRLVGGLVSGYAATRSPALLAKARDLGDRLLSAFASPTGIPYGLVNLQTGAVAEPVVSLSQAATHVAELSELSRLTGDSRYFDASRRAIEAIVSRRSALDLLPMRIDVTTGAWQDREATIDPPTDSAFEALWDGWELTRDRSLLDAFRVLTDAVIDHQAVRYRGRLWFRHVDAETGALISSDQSELAAFYAGLLAQSGHLRLGERFWRSWRGMLSRHPLLPERIDAATGAVLDPRNALRPEFVDSCLFLWLRTRDERYRRAAALSWRRERSHCRTPNGYTVADDVTTAPVKRGDLTPGYWWSESAKYYWLLFSGTDRFAYRRNVLTTEGNVLRGLRR